MTLTGRQLGRYRILEPLGSGGMSVVYKGHDTALDRVVAVKVLHPHLAGKEESRRRLAREARAVARLHHPNILEVFDFSGEGEQDAYLVTEYIQGQTLRQFMEVHALSSPAEVAALVVHTLSGALAKAHEAGVIHRDLKPENVMVREDGVLKLMDFGIAKILDRDERMTMTGALVGSPAHMAPEIIEGEEVGPEADVFSLGTMLYLFATGRLPFSGPNATATLKRILDGVYEDPRQVVPGLSDGLARIIATCLDRSPAARYPHAGALRDALADDLASVDLGRPEEELATFFAAPDAARALLTRRLVHSLLEQGEAAVAASEPGRALGLLNQVLALEEGNPQALALLERMNLARARSRRRRRLLQGAAALALVGVVGAGAWSAWRAAATSPVETPPPRAEAAPSEEAPPSALLPQQAPEALRPAPETPAPAPAVAAVAHPLPGGGRPQLPARPVAATAASRPLSTSPARRTVKLLVRPYAFVAVDGGPRSAEERQLHTLELAPGRHTVALSCLWCEDTEETIEVSAEGENVFPLGSQLKPSQLSFRFSPAEARVRVGAEERTVAESVKQPFVIRSPRGSTSFQHRVAYEVRLPGYQTQRGEVRIEAGKPLVLEGVLQPE